MANLRVQQIGFGNPSREQINALLENLCKLHDKNFLTRLNYDGRV